VRFQDSAVEARFKSNDEFHSEAPRGNMPQYDPTAS
jgi:hypothetical protein